MSLVEFREELHPRAGKGSPTGGQFTEKGISEEEKQRPAGRAKQQRVSDGIEGITDTELSALQAYSAQAKEVNARFRSGEGVAGSQWSKLDELLGRGSLSGGAVVYRIVGSETVRGQLDKLKPGEAITDNGYMSTSLYPYNDRLTMRIYVPQGAKGLVTGEHAGLDRPDEIIFARGSHLVYRGKDPNGVHEFDLDQDIETYVTGLDEAVIDVGGDIWNRETAVRLEREYTTAKPALEKLVTDMASQKVPTTTMPAPITKWSDLGEGEQEDIGKKWKEQNYSSFHDSEVENWYSESAENEATYNVVTDFDHYKDTTAGEHEEVDWAIDALELHINGRGTPDDDDYVPSREAAGKSRIPYTISQLITATKMSQKYQTEGPVNIEFDDALLMEPDTLIPGQMELPGFKEPIASEALTPSMREDLKKVITDALEERVAEVKDKLEPPDYLDESVKESLDMYWDEESDNQKFKWAKQFTDYIKAPDPEETPWDGKLPEKFDPLGESAAEAGTVSPRSEHENYHRTQALARAMSIERAMQLIKERNIQSSVWGASGEGVMRTDIGSMDARLWQNWKGASHSEQGKVLQAAISEELGGRLRTNGLHGVDIEKARASADEDYHGGFEAAKAYVRAKWETTQYLLDRANKPILQLYRGIRVPEVSHEAKEYFTQSASGKKWAVGLGAEKKEFNTQAEAEAYVAANILPKTETVQGHQKLIDLKIDRNGAASTTTDRAVANRWVEGHGDVVLRFRVPRTAVVSVPAYGQNIYGEHEVVIAGTSWYGWDAWKGEAPSFEDVSL